MRENGNRQGLDVVREHVVAALRERGRLGDAEQRDPGARACAEIETRVRTGLADEVDDVPMNAVLDVNGHCLFDHACDPLASVTGSKSSSGGRLVCSASMRASSAGAG